jgi:hypothetical protein
LLILYTTNITARLNYIAATLLPAMGITGFTVTARIDEYKNYTGAKINYSGARIMNDEVWIVPASLFSENNIQPQKIECTLWNENKIFFANSQGDLPFDIFSASFYLLTRYEEYLPHKLDMYGRYAHENSLAFKENFLHLPLVNVWLTGFRKLLAQKYPTLTFTPPTFQFIPTYDIDIAWSYLHKGLKRNTGAALRSLSKGELTNVKERQAVLAGKLKDPFDSYDWLDALHTRCGLSPIYFFLVAQKNKQYDKNILPSKPAFIQLVKQHALKYQLGIHPSWQSGDDKNLLKEEKNILENLAKKPVTKSRQHYIRVTLPETYRQLTDAGIQSDFSMGYGSINGFRASFCLPYKWYDLQNEQETPLLIYPFCFMDANSFYEQKFTAEQAAVELGHYADTVKNVNGMLITIWHNHFLGTDKMFAGWKEIYADFIAVICEKKPRHT